MFVLGFTMVMLILVVQAKLVCMLATDVDVVKGDCVDNWW
jgi:hypothetical protein